MQKVDHTLNAKRLPKSILPEQDSEKLARLLGEEVNELEAAFTDWLDPEQLSGIHLDRLGKSVGVSRDLKSDDVMRVEILSTTILSMSRYTLPAIVGLAATLSKEGTTPSVRELCYGIDEFSFWDGKSCLDGTDVMNPDTRPLALSIEMTISESVNPALVLEAFRRIRGPGVTLFFRLRVEIDEAVMSGTPDEAAVYLGETEIFRQSLSSGEIHLNQGACLQADAVRFYSAGVEVGRLPLGEIYPNARLAMVIAVSSSPPVIPEQEWNPNCLILIKADDQPDGSTIITDLSMYNRSIVPANQAQIDTAFYKFPPGSILLDGVSPQDYLYTPASTDWDLGNTFTLYSWIRLTSLSDHAMIFSCSGVGEGQEQWQVAILSSGEIGFSFGRVLQLSGPLPWTFGTWYKIAVVANNGALKFFRDQTEVYSGSIGNVLSAGRQLNIGFRPASADNYHPFIGNMDEIAVFREVLDIANMPLDISLSPYI